MLVRDIQGRLHIISRKDCKNDTDYYQKLLKIRTEYTTQYRSVVKKTNVKDLDLVIRNDIRNDTSNDTDE